MHEMSLVESIREIVAATAHANGATRVRAVRLRIGSLATVEPEALRFCFDVVMRGSVADGARLEIEHAPGAAWCWDCASPVAIGALTDACQACGGYRLEVTGGTEMRVIELELGAPEENGACA